MRLSDALTHRLVTTVYYIHTVLFITVIPAVAQPTNRDDFVAETVSDSFNEICNMEVFRPTCWKNEVIVIGKAFYGRRHTGRCLNVEDPNLMQNRRYLGCAADVTDVVVAKCSGKKHCEIRIPDSDLERTKPCLNDLKLFLEVTYSCAEDDRSCAVSLASNPLHIARPTDSFWSNVGQLHCGTKDQPWLLEAPPGQRINISLLDLTPTAAGLMADSKAADRGRTSLTGRSNKSLTDGDVSNVCRQHRQYGYVIDKSATVSSTRNVSVCASDSARRLLHVTLSASNEVEIILSSDEQLTFILSFQAVGCVDLVPPEDSWVQRDDNRLIVGCYTSRQTWQLNCVNGKWAGSFSNCTQYIPAEVGPVLASDTVINGNVPTLLRNYEVASIVTIVFVCVVLSLVVVCGGSICLYRFYARSGFELYRFKYRCVALPKPDGSSARDIELSIVGSNATSRYENLIYGSTGNAPATSTTPKTSKPPSVAPSPMPVKKLTSAGC